MHGSAGPAHVLFGDPPNIMIGSAVGLTFNDFVFALTPVVIVVMALAMVPLYFIWGRHLRAASEDRARVTQLDERAAITETRLLKQSLFVIALVIVAFVSQRQTGIAPATAAIAGAALLLLLGNLGRPAEEQSRNVHTALSEAG